MAAANRIEQFKKMANDDPTNPVGHLSLGREYLTAGMHAEAEGSLAKTIELDPKISKAYELLGQALLQLGRRDEAVDVLTRGARQADDRGEVLDVLADRRPHGAVFAAAGPLRFGSLFV